MKFMSHAIAKLVGQAPPPVLVLPAPPLAVSFDADGRQAGALAGLTTGEGACPTRTRWRADLLLAVTGFDEQVKRATQGHLDTRDVLIGLTMALAVGAGIVLWIYLRSKMKSGDQDRERLSQMMRSPGSSKSSSQGSGEKKSTTTVTESGLHRRRKRQRRRDHRQRNPSLSETGGLPPPRPDDQLPKY